MMALTLSIMSDDVLGQMQMTYDKAHGMSGMPPKWEWLEV